MNLPSIFKSTPVMKPSNQIAGSDKFDRNNIPQDMFGLGIQVFKIQSRKQIPNSNIYGSNGKSLGKARAEMKAIQNPVRRISNVPPVPPTAKAKKTSSLLPSIVKTPSQKQYKVEPITKTDSIFSRKSIQKNINLTKVQAIQEYPQSGNRNLPHKNKTFTNSRQTNKSMDNVPSSNQNQPIRQPLNQGTKNIIKQQWRASLNVIQKFMTQACQFQSNESTKMGRKKNNEYLGGQTDFIQAYITNNFYSSVLSNRDSQLFKDDKSYSFDPYSIQYYKIGANGGFENHNYEDYVQNQ